MKSKKQKNSMEVLIKILKLIGKYKIFLALSIILAGISVVLQLYVPIITMSMEGRGIVSRVCGEIFGSCVTFGCARKASAPGQIEADDLERAIKIIHENLYHKDEFENMQ